MRILLFIFCITIVCNSFAQQNVADSLQKILQQPITDSAKAKTMLLLGMAYEKYDGVKAHATYKELRDFATAKKMDFFVARSYFFDAFFFNLQGQYDTSIIQVNKGISIVKDNPSPLYQKEYAKELGILASNYDELGDYTKSAQAHLRIITIKEKLGLIEPKDYSNLAIAYKGTHELEAEKKWFDKALALAFQKQSPSMIFQAYIYLTLYYNDAGAYDTAKKYVDTLIHLRYVPYDTLVKELNPDLAYNIIYSYYLIVANTFENVKQYDTSLQFYNTALQFARSNNVERDISEPTLRAGRIYLLQKKYAKAEPLLLQAWQWGKNNSNMKVVEDASENIARLYAEMGNFQKAYQFEKEFHAVFDSLEGLDKRKALDELSTKYETQKKEDQIQLQASELKEKNLWNYVLTGSVITLIILSILLFINYRNKQTIQQQKIAELEAEQKLSATRAVLEGEEKERNRIAKDLHDGLSGMLSGVKFSLQNMKGNLIMTPENQQNFERSLDMLDNSIQEMRRVAQNMMPESLARYGLNTALKDYIVEINKSAVTTFVYQSVGMEKFNTDAGTGLSVFRIVQELINNVIKHASATECLVQLLFENGKLLINVEDNGKGLATGATETKEGLGWKNIRSRVSLLNGKIDITATEGKGSYINIELNIAS